MKFKTPIQYIKKIQSIDSSIQNDFHFNEPNNVFELLLTKSGNEYNEYRMKIIELMKSYYSYDISFLKQTQTFLQNIDPTDYHQNDCIEIWNKMNNFETNTQFCRNYNYIDYTQFERFNSNPTFMQIYSTYYLGSPIIQFLIPFILLLLPFFLMMFLQRENASFSNYVTLLKNVMKKHSLGNMFNIMSNEVDISTKTTSFLFLSLYFVSIYQNFLSCVKHYSNIQEMKHTLYTLYSHIEKTISNIDTLIETIHVHKLDTYSTFSKDIYEVKEKLEYYSTSIQNSLYIHNSEVHFNDILKIGKLTSLFYTLKDDVSFYPLIQETFYVNEFYNCISCFNINISNYSMNSNEYIETKNEDDNTQKFYISNQVNPILKIQSVIDISDTNQTNIVRHNVSLDNGIILTGGNATGKTTFLKTSFMNILLNQIFGYGFYEKANIPIYTKLFSYINIPDTNDRDSLFQNEAKRCLDIIHYLQENTFNNVKIFCVFDELFTGTNIDDATYAGLQCIKYLNTYNVDFILTTHFTHMVKQIKHSKTYTKKIRCFKTNKEYNLEKGISKIKIGKQILRHLGYPSDFFGDI